MRVKLFSYLTIDYKAGEAMLNGMAAQGWALKRLFLGLFAVFKRTERTDLRYFVDFGDSVYRESPDYLTLCADAGWVSVGYTRSMNLYASAPGAEPVPLQTDSQLEYERFRALVLKRVRTSGIVYLVLSVVLALTLLGGFSSFWANLCYFVAYSYAFNIIFLSMPAILVGTAAYMVMLLSRIREWRALTEAGEPISVPQPRDALRRSILTLLAGAFLLPCVFFFCMDALWGRGSLPFLIGYLTGSVIAFFILKKFAPRRRNPFSHTLVLLGITGLLLLLRFFLPSATAHFFQPTPQFPATAIAGTALPSTSHGSFWGRRDVWREQLGEESGLSMWVEVHTLCFDWLADGLQDYLSVTGMEPIPGHEGLLQADLGRNPLYGYINIPTSDDRFRDIYHTLLLRRGNSILLVEYPPDFPLEELLSAVDTWQTESRTGP